jgi:hypothetical protein
MLASVASAAVLLTHCVLLAAGHYYCLQGDIFGSTFDLATIGGQNLSKDILIPGGWLQAAAGCQAVQQSLAHVGLVGAVSACLSLVGGVEYNHPFRSLLN